MREVRLILAVTVLASILACVPSAWAAGGKDIASAPVVAYGQQEFGNAATDGGTNAESLYTDGHCSGPKTNGWWNMPVVTGDAVAVQWESPPDYTIDVFAVGTTDFSQPRSSAVAKSRTASNGKAELTFTASVSGTMSMVIGPDTCSFQTYPGPYAFTAYVKHAVVLSIPRRSSLARKGTVNVAVHTPDGAPITDPGLSVALRVQSGTKVRTVGKATVANGVAAVAYRLARSLRGRKVLLSARATGANYVSKTSTGLKLRVR